MYKKAIGLLILGNLVFLLGFVCVREAEALRVASWPVNQLKLELLRIEELDRLRTADTVYIESEVELAAVRGLGIMDTAVSDQRVVDYELVEQKPLYDLSDEELEALLKIVEAEAGSEDEDGRLLVANVVLNRVASDKFPDTVTGVVFQQSGGVAQFSPVASGRYYSVKVSQDTVTAVGRALMGEDISEGALFFASRKYASGDKMRWFDQNLTFLFEHGGHEFFK